MSVNSAQVLAFFDVELVDQVALQTEGIVYVSADSAISGTSLDVISDLKLVQRTPLSLTGECDIFYC